MNPNYVAQVGMDGSGKIARGQFLAQQGVRGLRRLTQSHWESIPIDSFSLLIIRDTSILFQHRNHGNFFDAQLTEALKVLEPNDRVLIFNIYGRDYGDKLVQLPPLEYKIE
jgi:hypothetical protein